MNIYDVIVVGSGAAGLMTAQKLSQIGLRVAVIEKSPRSHPVHQHEMKGGSIEVHITLAQLRTRNPPFRSLGAASMDTNN